MSGLLETFGDGRYDVLRRIGTGGTSTVFLARDVVLEREVAVKRVHGAEVAAETALRLRREARILAGLRHPNLVAVYDMLVEGDDLLLVMEYVRGGTLADVLRGGPIGWPRTFELLGPVAVALDYAHGQGVVHRDVKPSNVLVGVHDEVKLADLGLATAAEITNITPPGAIVGTPAYMAPEQARSAPCTAAADIFALATIVFQALSGALPRPGKTVMAILAQATREPPPDLRDHRPETPPAVAAALARAMSAQPERRPRSACGLLRDIDAAFSDSRVSSRGSRPSASPTQRSAAPILTSPPVRHSRHRGTRLAAVGALAAAMLAAAIVIVSVAGNAPSRPQATPPPAHARGTAADKRAASAASATPSATPSAGAGASPYPSAAASATPRPPRKLSASATVRAFYQRAAGGRYRAAWRLAGPAMRAAFGDRFDQFRAQLSSLRDIEFKRVTLISRTASTATVQIETIATHTNRVDHCTGTLRTVRTDRGRWLVDPAGVHCTAS